MKIEIGGNRRRAFMDGHRDEIELAIRGNILSEIELSFMEKIRRAFPHHVFTTYTNDDSWFKFAISFSVQRVIRRDMGSRYNEN